MPGTLTLEVGTNVSALAIAGTNTKINNVILRFLAARGKSTEGLTATQIGQLYLSELKEITIVVASEKQIVELTVANETTIQATVAADNSI